jgi:predicted acyltransferase (DUF342 family)
MRGVFTMKIAKPVHHESGSVMLTVLFFAIAVSIVGFAASTLVVSGNRNVHTISTLKQAHYLAEMGIEDVLSNPFVLRDTLLYDTYTYTIQSSVELESGKRGTYQTTMSKKPDNTIKIESKGFVRNQNDALLATKTIRCEFQIKSGTFYDILLKNAISTSQNLNSGKVYIYIDKDENDNPVASSADVYSDAEITNIAGTVPGSVIAQGRVIVNNNTTIAKDVIAKGNIVLNNNAQVGGKVISAESYIDVNNNAVVSGDIVAYGADDKGYSVYLTNSTVQDIYTKLGSSQVKEKNSRYKSIGTIPKLPEYPETYNVPRQSLPIIDDTIKAAWIAQAQSDGITFNGLNVNNDQTFTIDGNAYINGDLVLNDNSTLRVKEGSIVYVTGKILIENNASVSVVDSNGDQTIARSSLITADSFDIRNNAIPNVLSLVALGSSTSYLKNNSVTTGAILVPNGNLEISNNATIYGGIFAKSIPKIGNNAKIYFNPLNNLGLPHTVTSSQALDLLSWTE